MTIQPFPDQNILDALVGRYRGERKCSSLVPFYRVGLSTSLTSTSTREMAMPSGASGSPSMRIDPVTMSRSSPGCSQKK